MVMVNGEPAQQAAGQTVFAFLTGRQAPVDNIVVELNGEILHRPQFETTQIQPNDKLELISFVGGGR